MPADNKPEKANKPQIRATNASVKDLTAAREETQRDLASIRKRFPDAHKSAKDDRRTSQGRMGLEENTALRSVVDGMDLAPAIFAVLADEDEGHDPNKLETDLLRERLDAHAVYLAIAEELSELAAVFSDTALRIGAQVKPVALAGYEIAKPLSKRMPALREKISPALNYYSGNATAGAEARAAKAAKKDG